MFDQTTTQQADTNSRDRLITIDEVLARVSLSKATLWRLRKRHAFPDPVQVSPGRKLFSENALNRWIAGHLSAA
jgi:predicted DNA-binding transcriptional regulator AlpA